MLRLDQINKKVLIGVLAVVVIVLLTLLATLFQSFIGSRALPPGLSEGRKVTMDGDFSSNNLSVGTHMLTFSATLSDGRQVTNSRSFEITSPDGGNITPPPYGAQTSTPSPATARLTCRPQAPWYDVNGDNKVDGDDSQAVIDVINGGPKTAPNGAAWQNPTNPYDVTDAKGTGAPDGVVAPIDSLAISNFVNAHFGGRVPDCGSTSPTPYADTPTPLPSISPY